ncbi:cytochrome P450, partial [Rhizopogon vinicolor AM-OR11-026]
LARMFLPQIIGYGVLTLAVFKLIQRRASRKSIALNVAGPESDHWLKGNVESMFVDGFERCLEVAADYGGLSRMIMMCGLQDEWLYVSDPRVLHYILVKEQHIFEENDVFLFCNQLMFGEGLISTLGEQHRKQRKMLNPVFSTCNMRELLPITQTVSHHLRSVLVANLSDHTSVEFDVLPWLSRSALDCICEGMPGYHSNAIDTGNDNEYVEALRMLAPFISRTILFRRFVPMVMRYLSLYWRKKLVDLLTISWLPTQTMKDFRELHRIVEVMDSASRTIFQEKKAALDQPGSPIPSQSSWETRGKDIMSIMLKSNASSSEADRLSDAELLGQMNVMIFAGLETTTAAVGRALYMLAKHPHIQERLRAEINDAMAVYQFSDVHSHAEDNNGSVRLPYDALMSLPLLDAVVRETLRLYPSLPILLRRTTEATSLPLQFPVRSASGEEINAVPVAENQRIVMSILAANHNQAVWGKDASDWKPERWLNSSQGDTPGVKVGVRYTGVYSSMMTFLTGSRSCIGFKFAEMEIRIHWMMTGFFAPVIKPPAGDGKTPQLPLSMRLVRK